MHCGGGEQEPPELVKHERLGGKGQGEFEVEMSLLLCQKDNGARAHAVKWLLC